MVAREIEGDLHDDKSVVSLLKWTSGMGPIVGSAQVGSDQASTDVIVGSDGRPQLQHPLVTFSRQGETLRGNLSFPEGTPKETMVEAIRKRLEREGFTDAEAAATRAVEGASLVSQSVEVTANKEADFPKLRRHAAKIALAAATTLPEVHVGSDFSESLRQKLHSSDGLPDQHVDAPRTLRARREALRAEVIEIDTPEVKDGLPAAQVTFLPISAGTLIDVHLLGQTHLAGPFLVVAGFPPAGDSLVAIVRETAEPLSVIPMPTPH